MSNTNTHPSSDELSAFSLGQLRPEAAQRVEEHVNSCNPCCQTIVSLASDDTFVDLLQEVATSSRSDSQSSGDDDTGESADLIPAPLESHPRYTVERLIGRGGMGRVYKARHCVMDRTVALKVINREWVRRPEVIDRFQREVKTAASLTHPNIVTAHDAEQAEDLHFLVMEHVDGVDLAEMVNERGPLPVAEACEYIYQAAQGLHYAHSGGMVHRDIKPHNLMLTRDKVLKILDFGLASLAPQATSDEPISEDGSGNLTIAGTIMGTPDFISPEQAQDAHKVDGRSDIYSLGMTLYYLLAGKVPFGEGAATEKLRQHAEEEPAPVATIRDDVPHELQDIVLRMTAKSPADRFQSPQEVADALRPFASSMDDATSSVSEDSRGTPSMWRRLAWVAVALAVMGLAASLLQSVVRSILVPATDEVHASLKELDSYVVAMMESPHDLVFMNLSEIGPDGNYLIFEKIQQGVRVKLPAFPDNPFDKRQSRYGNRFREVAESLSLTTEDRSEFRDGQIAGVNIAVKVTGDSQQVAESIRQLAEKTFAVEATEECEYTFRNLPSVASGRTDDLTRVTGDEFVEEYRRGERVYFGEIADEIYLIPRDRRFEKKFQRDSDVWYANINELPPGVAARIRRKNGEENPGTAEATEVSEANSGGEERFAAEKAAGIPGTPASNPVGYLTWRVSYKKGELTQQLKSLISQAAGIPNDEWENFARSPLASFETINGEPLSLVLLTLNPTEAAKSNERVLTDFRLHEGRHPKPNDFNRVMAISKARGFYSMLQPDDMPGIPFVVHAEPEAKGGSISGQVTFLSDSLYSGQVEFIVDIDTDYSMTVTEFKLPNYGIIVRRSENGTWKRVKSVTSLEEARKALVGSWRSIRGVTSGREMPREILKTMRIDFTEDRYTVSVPGEGRFAEQPWADCSWNLTESNDGWFIELTGKHEQAFRGIVDFDGEDRLRICLSNPDSPLPKDFESRPGSPHTLSVLERISGTPQPPGE